MNDSYGFAQTNPGEIISKDEIYIQDEAFDKARTIYQSLWKDNPDNDDYRLSVELFEIG